MHIINTVKTNKLHIVKQIKAILKFLFLSKVKIIINSYINMRVHFLQQKIVFNFRVYIVTQHDKIFNTIFLLITSKTIKC